jgi:DNA-binding beta-propeller fold protein YncE
MRSAFPLTLLASGVLLGQMDLPHQGIYEPGVITTRQTITPAGKVTTFRGALYGVAYSDSSSQLEVLTDDSVFSLDIAGNRIASEHKLNGRPGLQAVARSTAGNRMLFVSIDSKRGVELNETSGDTVRTLASHIGRDNAASIAVATTAAGRHIAAICETRDNALAVVDLDSHAQIAQIETGISPFGVALNADGSVAWVTNWGGRRPGKNDRADPAGNEPDSDRVLVDSRGIASSGTVSRIDLESKKVTATIDVGLHPTALLLDQRSSYLYVANTNGDSVSIVDTRTSRVISTRALAARRNAGFGIAPTAFAESPGGTTIYIACGGINAVAVAEPGSLRIRGFIPTAWYPGALAASPDGKTIAIGSLLGIGSGYKEDPRRKHVRALRGTLQIVDIPSPADLANYTTAVMENSHLTDLPGAPLSNGPVEALPVPRRAGDPSLIDHVVYIIKENRSHDQMLGDAVRGNHDPALTEFPRRVSTNHHRLAEQFVMYDNFFATGTSSGDGHQWATQANETAYCLWPGYTGRSYPFEGSDPLAPSSSGFIWDLAASRHRTVAIFGEYAGREADDIRNDRNELVASRHKLMERWRAGDQFLHDWNTHAPMRSVNRFLVTNYPAYSLGIPDVVRARIFGQSLQKWISAGKMPNLVIMQLPSDHTNGTFPDANTPSAMVADNDYALGQIVDMLSHSPFWKKMAIFVVEDDAQNGFDHVDGHRTVALALSPYIRRESLDSTFYSHPSVLKTIELMLGLPTMSMFDLIANDMRASFTTTPDFTPYDAVMPEQSLDERNPPASQLKGEARRAALDSAKMNWKVPDAVPTRRLNAIIWHNTMGWNKPLPKVKTSLLAPGDAALGVGDDEDDQ